MSEAPKRGPGRPPKYAKAEAVADDRGMVRVEIISHLHAFGEDGQKFWCGETPTVPAQIAEDWIKNGRALPL